MKLRRAVVGLVVAVGLAGLASGCGAVSALTDTQQGLRDAGFASVHVGFHFGGAGDEVDVTVRVSAVPSPVNAAAVASVVWQRLHQRFDRLQVTVDGRGPKLSRDFTFSELQATFGARNPAWNRTSIRSSFRRAGVAVLIGVAVVAVAVVVIIVAVVQRNRHRRPPWPGYPGWPAPGAGGPGWVPPGGPGWVPPGGPGWVPPGGPSPGWPPPASSPPGDQPPPDQG